MLDRLDYIKKTRKNRLANGYQQVELHPDHYPKTAFQSRFSLFKYFVMPLDLKKIPGIFQRLINSVFSGIP